MNRGLFTALLGRARRTATGHESGGFARLRASPPDAHNLIACYVCDALDHDERSTFEAHLETCSACIEEVEQLREVTALLAIAVSAPPPERLYARVHEAIAEWEARQPQRFSLTTRKTISARTPRERRTRRHWAHKRN
jgi:anti-sigma factor RsiW